MIDIRITCTEKELVGIEESLKRAFKIISISAFYPNRGKTEQGRVYIKAEPKSLEATK